MKRNKEIKNEVHFDWIYIWTGYFPHNNRIIIRLYMHIKTPFREIASRGWITRETSENARGRYSRFFFPVLVRSIHPPPLFLHS